MIEIVDKRDCCGCEACRQVCPQRCIAMQRDEEGFLYATIDKLRCIECHLCERVCPMINSGERRVPRRVVATTHRNEGVRRASSSGGVFSALASATLRRGGVVFGARFDKEYNVVHAYVESEKELSVLRGSKYVQSTIGDSFRQAEELLKAGRRVLFTATPCQIAGLRRYLRREYEELLCVEVVCHGVPSPKVWQEYLRWLVEQLHTSKESVRAISFRDKSHGWKRFCFKMEYATANGDRCYVEPMTKNLFLQGFFKNLYLRPSCYHCTIREGCSGADISIADFWGVERIMAKYDDDWGISLVMANTAKGEEALASISDTTDSVAAPYDKALQYNPCITRSVAEPRLRAEFWTRYAERGVEVIAPICNKLKVSILRRAWNKLRRVIKL